MGSWLRRSRLALIVAFTYAYFLSGGGPNQATRFSLTESIVERHTGDISAVQYRTLDKGYRNGRYYADKAPGVSLLSIVPYLSMRAADRAFGIDPSSRAAQNAKQYVLSLLFAAGAGVLATLLLRRIVRAAGCSERAAELTALAYAFGTIAFPFSTILFGHQLATLLIVGSFSVALEARARAALARPGILVALGAIWGLTLMVEYPAALIVAVLGLSVIGWTFDRSAPLRSVLHTLQWTAIGGLPLILFQMWALHAIYGRIVLPYSFVSEPVFRSHMSGGFLGIGVPTITATYGSLFSPYRGLFFFCPVVLLMFAGIGCWIDSRSDRTPLASIAAALVVYLVFACSYYAWDGGGSVGPRHLTPWIPLAMVPIGFFVDRFRWGFHMTVVLGLASAAIMLAATYTTIELPIGDPYVSNPLYDIIARVVVEGRLPLPQVDSFVPYPQADEATNWGLLLGLGPQASLLVVPIVWVAAYVPELFSRGRTVRHA